MKSAPVVIAVLSALLLGAAALAQAPLSQIDTHIVTAKTAAGQDYRGTFVNLCLPSASFVNGTSIPVDGGMTIRHT